MEYIEIRIEDLPGEIRDIIMYYLGEEGYDSFTEDGNDLLAYIPSKWYDSDTVRGICDRYGKGFTETLIPEQNWNEEWEKNFEPVLIGGSCLVRAPFHQPVEGVDYEIVIMPKMSFGTAHHETTAGMIKAMLELDLQDKKVLDMGCGTGVLAIFAEKRGAAKIFAIDNDHWAFENAIENVERNNCKKISVKEGGTEQISGTFDVILANINRNILLDQISHYAGCALPGSKLLMSGFYEEDLNAIRECAGSNGFHFDDYSSVNRWVTAIFSR